MLSFKKKEIHQNQQTHQCPEQPSQLYRTTSRTNFNWGDFDLWKENFEHKSLMIFKDNEKFLTRFL